MKSLISFFLCLSLALSMGGTITGQLAAVAKKRAPGGGGGSELLWYKFNAGSGTVLAAEAGPAGTTTADRITGASGSGSASNFVVSNFDFAVTDSAITFGTDVITVCCWLYCNDVAITQIVLETSADAGGGGNNWHVLITGTKLFCQLFTGDAINYRSESISPSTGAWHHYAFVIDNSTNAGSIKIYVDGTEASTTIETNTKASSGNFSTEILNIAARSGGPLFFDGRMDDLRIYAGELSGAAISAIYADPQ